MTYGKLFFRLLREDFRRRAWSFFLGLFVFFLALPAAYQLLYGSMTFEAVRAVKAARELFSLGNSLIALITGAASVICAPGGFAYLFRRSTTDYYHSLPVRREFLFLVKYCCGILIYALPFGICLLLTLPLIAAKGGLTPEVLTDAYMLFVVHMTAYLVLYSVALTAVFLTGTLVVSILMAGTLFLYGVIVRALRIFLMDTFLDTYYMAYGPLGKTETVLSPITYYFRLLDHPQNLFLGWGIALLFSLLALQLYRMRPSEAAGRTLVFPKTQLPVKLLSCVPASLLGGLFFYSMRRDISWFFFGLLAFWLAACVFLEMLFAQSFRQGLAHRRSSLLALAISVLLTLILSQDLLGYNTHLPDRDSLASMAIDFRELDTSSDTYVWNDKGYLSHLSRTEYRLEHMQITGMDAAYALAQDSARLAGEGHGGDMTCIVRYTTSSGRDIYREYPLLLLEQEGLIAQVYASPEYKEGCFPVLTDGAHKDAYTGIWFQDLLGREQFLPLAASDMDALLEAFTADLLACTLEDTKSQAAGELSFQITLGTMYDGQAGRYLVYDGYARTLAKLQELGLSTAFDAEDVSYIEIFHYPDSQESEDSPEQATSVPLEQTYVFSSPEEIEAILPCLRIGQNRWFYEADPDFYNNCSIDIYPVELPEGQLYPSYMTYYIHVPDAPDFLREKLGI